MMMAFVGDTTQIASYYLIGASSPTKQKFFSRLDCQFGSRRTHQTIYSLEMFLVVLIMCTKLSSSLVCPLQCRIATNAMKYRSIHSIDLGPNGRYVYDWRRHRNRFRYASFTERRSTVKPYDDEDGDEKYIDDDTDSDEYLQHLISDAINEEEKLINIPSRQKNSVALANDESSAKDSTMEETKRMMEQQQQQIDLLMKLVQAQQQPTETTNHEIPSKQKEHAVNVTPLKVMIFIDGTWLYYSLHARKKDRCTVTRKFGKGWQANYKVDWLALPRLICNEIDKLRGGQNSFKGSDRPLDISRVSVFTSAKKDTDPNSIRMRMFRDMANANYDVHMMETVGRGEKCVDIQLAVEMLHYATVPNAFDMAVILTGDKDFVPALVRTRQKGKEVVICSMKSGCNRVLYESPHIRDYDVVWLENCLDGFIIPIPEEERNRLNTADYASAFTMMRVIRDYVQAAPDDIDYVSSRDIGRYLKSVKIADSDMLDELKKSQGGLWTFLTERACHLFEVQLPDLDQASDHSFGVIVKEDSDDILVEEFKKTQYFTNEEKRFLENYRKPINAAYSHTEYTNAEDLSESTDASMPNYSSMKMAALKDICREKNLPVSGKKDALIERLEKWHREFLQLAQLASQKRRREWKEAPAKTIARMNSPNNVYSETLPQLDVKQTKKTTTRHDPQVAAHLEALVKEYLICSGGIASSRDIGRYLSANSDSRNAHTSALAELKEAYGSLLSFLHSRSAFYVDNTIPESHMKTNGFPVKLVER